MKQYYLSYVEKGGFGGHSALMVSCSENEALPHVVSGFGFVMDTGLDHPLTKQIFTSVAGWIQKENIASQVKYSKSTKVRHKTFAISESEYQHLQEILARYQLPKDDAVQLEDIKTADAPNFSLHHMTCKRFALDVFKELDIIDATTLANPLIQLPGLTSLRPLYKEDFNFDEKDRLIQRINAVQTSVEDFIELLENNKTLSKQLEELSELNKFFQENKVYRFDKDWAYHNKAIAISSFLSDSANAQLLKDIPGYEALAKSFKSLYTDLRAYQDDPTKRFGQWATLPQLEARVHIDKLAIKEQQDLLVQAQYSDVYYGIKEMMALFASEKKVSQDKSYLSDIERLAEELSSMSNSAAGVYQKYQTGLLSQRDCVHQIDDHLKQSAAKVKSMHFVSEKAQGLRLLILTLFGFLLGKRRHLQLSKKAFFTEQTSPLIHALDTSQQRLDAELSEHPVKLTDSADSASDNQPSPESQEENPSCTAP